MKTIDNEEKIKKLEKTLKEMRKHHRNAWDIYGSELCAGDMMRKEEELEEEIKKLKNDTDRFEHTNDF